MWSFLFQQSINHTVNCYKYVEFRGSCADLCAVFLLLFDTNMIKLQYYKLDILYLLSSLPCSSARIASEAARTGFCKKKKMKV